MVIGETTGNAVPDLEGADVRRIKQARQRARLRAGTVRTVRVRGHEWRVMFLWRGSDESRKKFWQLLVPLFPGANLKGTNLGAELQQVAKVFGATMSPTKPFEALMVGETPRWDWFEE